MSVVIHAGIPQIGYGNGFGKKYNSTELKNDDNHRKIVEVDDTDFIFEKGNISNVAITEITYLFEGIHQIHLYYNSATDNKTTHGFKKSDSIST